MTEDAARALRIVARLDAMDARFANLLDGPHELEVTITVLDPGGPYIAMTHAPDEGDQGPDEGGRRQVHTADTEQKAWTGNAERHDSVGAQFVPDLTTTFPQPGENTPTQAEEPTITTTIIRGPVPPPGIIALAVRHADYPMPCILKALWHKAIALGWQTWRIECHADDVVISPLGLE